MKLFTTKRWAVKHRGMDGEWYMVGRPEYYRSTAINYWKDLFSSLKWSREQVKGQVKCVRVTVREDNPRKYIHKPRTVR